MNLAARKMLIEICMISGMDVTLFDDLHIFDTDLHDAAEAASAKGKMDTATRQDVEAHADAARAEIQNHVDVCAHNLAIFRKIIDEELGTVGMPESRREFLLGSAECIENDMNKRLEALKALKVVTEELIPEVAKMIEEQERAKAKGVTPKISARKGRNKARNQGSDRPDSSSNSAAKWTGLIRER